MTNRMFVLMAQKIDYDFNDDDLTYKADMTVYPVAVSNDYRALERRRRDMEKDRRTTCDIFSVPVDEGEE